MSQLDDERARFRTAMGRYGIWSGRFGGGPTPELAAEADRLGFGSLWIGGSPGGGLERPEALLAATERLVVATGIVNIWRSDAHEIAASFHRIEARHPGRFILGIGAGHPENEAQAAKPYAALVAYLDALEADGVPQHRLAMAALGDRVLALAGERTLGAHPYFVPTQHTAHARQILGPDPLLVPEQRVLFETDPATAREILLPAMRPYFHLRNYRSNLLRLGFEASDLDAETDEVVDRIAVWGDDAKVRAGVGAQLGAGADHVVVQLAGPGDYQMLPLLPRLAGALGLA